MESHPDDTPSTIDNENTATNKLELQSVERHNDDSEAVMKTGNECKDDSGSTERLEVLLPDGSVMDGNPTNDNRQVADAANADNGGSTKCNGASGGTASSDCAIDKAKTETTTCDETRTDVMRASPAIQHSVDKVAQIEATAKSSMQSHPDNSTRAVLQAQIDALVAEQQQQRNYIKSFVASQQQHYLYLQQVISSQQSQIGTYMACSIVFKSVCRRSHSISDAIHRCGK